MEIKKYIYASDGTLDGQDEAVLIPLSNFLGVEPFNSSTTQGSRVTMYFEEVSTDFDTNVSRIHFGVKTGFLKEAMEQITAAIASNPKDGFIIFDQADSNYSASGENFINSISFTVIQS